jgi:hypothetical protein
MKEMFDGFSVSNTRSLSLSLSLYLSVSLTSGVCVWHQISLFVVSVTGKAFP